MFKNRNLKNKTEASASLNLEQNKRRSMKAINKNNENLERSRYILLNTLVLKVVSNHTRFLIVLITH